MTRGVSILGISGSTRKDSLNARLLRGMAPRFESADVEIADLREFPLPLYDGDLEQQDGVPEHAAMLRRMIMQHDALLIACPEHNGSVTALLKNTLDWCSRPSGGVDGLAPFRQKPALIVGTSVSPFGAVRALGHLRAILGKMGAVVFPEDVAVPDGSNALAADGLPVAEAQKGMVDKICANFADFARRTAHAAAA